MVVIHLFSGHRRKGDVLDHLERMANSVGLPILLLSADLAIDQEWDLADDRTFSKLYELCRDGLVDVI